MKRSMRRQCKFTEFHYSDIVWGLIYCLKEKGTPFGLASECFGSRSEVKLIAHCIAPSHRLCLKSTCSRSKCVLSRLCILGDRLLAKSVGDPCIKNVSSPLWNVFCGNSSLESCDEYFQQQPMREELAFPGMGNLLTFLSKPFSRKGSLLPSLMPRFGFCVHCTENVFES